MNDRICVLGVIWGHVVFSIAFLFGAAASVSVPFDSRTLSLAHVANFVGQTTIHSLLAAPLVLFVPTSFVCVACFFLVQRPGARRVISVLTAALPAFFLDSSRLAVQVVALPFVAFYMPAQQLLGKTDGEFWAESWPCYTLMGWWLIIWLVVIGREKWARGNGLQDKMRCEAGSTRKGEA